MDDPVIGNHMAFTLPWTLRATAKSTIQTFPSHVLDIHKWPFQWLSALTAMTLFLLHAICCHGNDMVQMRNVSESHSFPNFRSEEPQPSRSLGATCSLNPWPDTCWYFQFLGAKRTVHERASFDSLQFTHCTRTTGQCRTTQRGKSQFDTCQHPVPFILLGIQAIKDAWSPLSRDIPYWLHPQKLKGWLYFVLRFHNIICRYRRIYFIYLRHAAFSMFATRPPLPRCFLMRPRAAGEGADTFGNGPFQSDS